MTAALSDREVKELGVLFNRARDPMLRLASALAALGRSRVTMPLNEERIALVLTPDEARRALEALD